MCIRSRATWVALVVVVVSSEAGPAWAEWLPDGSPIAVYNCEESPTAAVSDDNGGMFVFWTDNRACTGTRIYAQHLLASGALATGWPVGGIPVSTFASRQELAVAVPDGNGGAIVVWRDYRTGDPALCAQRVAPDGTRLWPPGDVRVSPTPGRQLECKALADGSGGAFLVWRDSRRGLDDGEPHHHTLYDLYAQRLDATGANTWPIEGIPVDSSASTRGTPVLVTDGGSGVHITWPHASGSTHLQHLRGTGSSAFAANGLAIEGRFYGEQTADGAGGIIAAFMYGSDTLEDLYAQRVDSTGALTWPLNGVLVASAAFGQRPNAILPDGAGGAFIAWYDLRNGQNWDVYAERITASGAPAPGWLANGRPVCAEPGFQIYPRMIADDSGGVIVAWYDARDTSTAYDIYAQRIDGLGATVPGWQAGGTLLCGATGNQSNPISVRDGSGGALVTWDDYRGYSDVYAQRVSGAGVVGDAGPVVGVEDGPSFALALGPVFPNPVAQNRLVVSFTIPGTAPALLSLIDARGRVIVTRAIGRGNTGRFTFSTQELARLPTGIYLLRLEQLGRSVSGKVSILR